MISHPYRGRRRWQSHLRRLLLALGALTALGSLWLYRQATYHPSEPLPPPPAPAETQQAVKHVKDQVRRIQQQKAQGQRAPYRLHLSSQDANTLLANHPKPSGDSAEGISDIRNARVSFESGRVVVHGDVTYRGRSMYLTVGGRLLPDGSGSVMFDPEEMLIGKLPMPSALREHVARKVESTIRSRIAEMGLSVNSVEIANGQVVIQGLTGAQKEHPEGTGQP